MITGYMIYHQSADSYHSTPSLPIAVFTDEEVAIEFAKTQGGYGYNRDWFVKPIDIDPDIPVTETYRGYELIKTGNSVKVLSHEGDWIETVMAQNAISLVKANIDEWMNAK